MNPWTILEIDQTTDKTTIKRAYSKLIKKYHPEEDPQGFMRIRKAYETALDLADKLSGKDFGSAVFGDYESEYDDEDESDDNLYEEDADEDYSDQHDGFEYNDEYDYDNYLENEFVRTIMNKVDQLYNDFFKRIDLKEWKNLFQNFTVFESEQISNGIVYFLNNKYHLPKAVWLYLEKEFSLLDNRYFTREEFIIEESELSYNYFTPSVDCDYDKYVELRYLSHGALIQRDYEKVKKYGKDAVDIFDKDPDIYKILGIACYKLGDYKGASEEYTKVLQINPSDFDILVKRGYSHLKESEYNNAIDDFNKVLVEECDNLDAQKGLIFALEGAGKVKDAQEKFLKLNEKFENDIKQRDLELELLFYKRNKYSKKTKEDIKRALSKYKKYKYLFISLIILNVFILEKMNFAILAFIISIFVRNSLLKKEINNESE